MSEMMTWIGTSAPVAAQVSLAVVFLWAGLSKVRSSGALASTIEGLGVGSGLAGVLAPTVILAEVGAGTGLLATPSAWWPRALAVALALGFAVAGSIAIVSKRQISCACFGNVGSGRLGWRQVWLLPGWVGLAGVAQWRPPDWGWEAGLTLVAFTLLGMAILRMPGHLRLVRRLQGDRVALAPSYRGASRGEYSDDDGVGEESEKTMREVAAS